MTNYFNNIQIVSLPTDFVWIYIMVVCCLLLLYIIVLWVINVKSIFRKGLVLSNPYSWYVIQVHVVTDWEKSISTQYAYNIICQYKNQYNNYIEYHCERQKISKLNSIPARLSSFLYVNQNLVIARSLCPALVYGR